MYLITCKKRPIFRSFAPVGIVSLILFNNKPELSRDLAIFGYWLFGKALRRFPACLLVNNNLCGNFISSSELTILFDDTLKTNSVLLFIADFNLLSCEFDRFTFKLSYWVTY